MAHTKTLRRVAPMLFGLAAVLLLILALRAGARAAGGYVSRQELAELLYAADTGASGASDSGPAVDWTLTNGLINGDGSGFGADDPVTREQAAAILYRYAAFKGDPGTISTDLSAYPDAGLVSGWAVRAMGWAVGRSLLPAEGGLLEPDAAISPGAAAAMLDRYMMLAPFSHATGAVGVRQLGGYAAADGRTVKDGLLLSALTTAGASAADIGPLGAADGPVRVLDLDAAAVSSGAVPGTTDYYRLLVSDQASHESFRAFFRTLVEQDGGALLWHCPGGADKAAVASALLLRALGVDKETVIQDFLLTNETAAGRRVDRRWLEAYFQEIDQLYGSFDNFTYTAMGLSKDYKDILKARYLA